MWNELVSNPIHWLWKVHNLIIKCSSFSSVLIIIKVTERWNSKLRKIYIARHSRYYWVCLYQNKNDNILIKWVIMAEQPEESHFLSMSVFFTKKSDEQTEILVHSYFCLILTFSSFELWSCLYKNFIQQPTVHYQKGWIFSDSVRD